MPLRDDAKGAVYRSADGGRTWEAIGGFFRDVSFISLASQDDTYLVGAVERDSYGSDEETSWAEIDGSDENLVEGEAAQIVRPSGDFQAVFPSEIFGATVIDAAGVCAAYWDDDDEREVATLRVVNTETGSDTALFEAPFAEVTYRQVVWLNE